MISCTSISKPLINKNMNLSEATMVSTQDINTYLNKLPATIAAAPLDRKIAYYSIILGILLIIIGVIAKILF